MKSRRTFLSLAAASTGLMAVAVAGPAQAAPPQPTPFSFTLPSQQSDGVNGFCKNFPVLVEGTSYQELRGGGKITGRGTATVTNRTTGKSLTYNINGPATVTTTPDGGFAVDATGPNLLYTTVANSYPGVPQLAYTTGHVQFTVNGSGLTTSYHLSGKSTDVCAALS
jgi:hypothetical protein